MPSVPGELVLVGLPRSQRGAEQESRDRAHGSRIPEPRPPGDAGQQPQTPPASRVIEGGGSSWH